MFQEAYQSTWEIDTVIIREDAYEALAKEIDTLPTEQIMIANKRDFQALSTHVQAEGIITILSFPDTKDRLAQSNARPFATGPTFILDGIQDPGNLGTIIRTIDWFAIPNLVYGPGTVDLYSPKTLRSSMGSVFRVHTTYVKDLLAFVQQCQGKVWLTAMRGTPLSEVDFRKNDFIILGNEANGISEALKGLSGIHFVSIVGKGSAESLNVGVAAGIMAWEISKML